MFLDLALGGLQRSAAALLESCPLIELGLGIRRAFRLGIGDLENAIQAAAALEAEIGVLVSRDAKDYKGLADLQVLSPDIALAALAMERPRKAKK